MTQPGAIEPTALLGEALSLVAAHALPLAGVGFLAHLALSALMALTGVSATQWELWASLAVGPLIGAVLQLMAADALDGRAPRLAPHVARVRDRAVLLILVSAAAGVATGAGLMAFVVPGLYIAAALLIVTPLVLFEDMGFDALVTSWESARGQVWRLVGLLLLAGVVALGALVPALLVWSMLGGALGMPILADGVMAAFSGAVSAAMAAMTVLVHRRLRGGPAGAQVFE